MEPVIVLLELNSVKIVCLDSSIFYLKLGNDILKQLFILWGNFCNGLLLVFLAWKLYLNDLWLEFRNGYLSCL